MPVTSTGDSERDRERSKDGDRDEKGERGLSKSQQKLSSSKTKDLSHVPCKFFKVGSCTAGSSCPFSHTVLEPGAQKDVCAWFVKGNCKFGHKCALAHVLPGQSMSMDRKNKKAAQVATGGGKSDSKSSGRPGKRDAQGRPPALMSLKASISPSAPAPAIKNTDFASFGVLDETSKLPSAPAHGKQPVQGSTDAEPSSNKSSTSSSEAVEIKEPSSTPAQPVSPSLPVSSPRRSDREHSPASRAPIDFGPIGSPPRSSNATSHPHPVSRLNGSTNHGASFSPGTSPSARNNNGTPTNTFLSTSPFSAPGSQTVFNFSERSGMGIATSLGSGYAMSGGTGTAHGKPTWGSQVENEDNLVTRRAQALEMASSGNREEGGDDFEDFLPSSLTDLLTPEERSRRMLRTNSGQGAAAQGDSTHPIVSPSGRTLGVPLATPSGPGNGHRYSRSVPAPSLLGDIGSIWSTNQGAANGGLTPNAGTPLSGGLPSSPGRLGGLGNGTPGSFTQGNSGFGGRATFDPLGEEFAGSPSNFLAPSNASAAFLPGIHAQYLKSKQGQTLDNGIGGVIRNTGSPLYPSTGKGTLQSSLAAATSRLTGGPGYGTPTGTGSFADLGQNGEFLQRPTLFSSNTANNNSMRPIPSSHLSSNNDDPQFALSPATRALQSHAPGQSLPQGLAAGYSRIHALPPPLPLSSPGSGGIGAGGFSVSPGLSATFNAGPYGSNNGPNNRPNEWGGSVGGGFSRLYSGISQSNSGLNLGGPPGLALPSHYMGINVNNTGDSAHTGAVGAGEPDPMSSKLSYSAAAAKGAPAGGVVSPHKSQWDGQQQGATGASSPLNKPVTGDDDDLFILDA